MVPIVSALALLSWLGVLIRNRHSVRHTELMPDAVTEGALVAVLAATLGGTLASLGFIGVVGSDPSAVLAIAWRMAVLVCGVYAFIGSAMGARRG